MTKKSIAPYPYVPAMPVVIVAVQDGDKLNFAPHGMYGQLSVEPPLVYISVVKTHQTAQMIRKAAKFSINIPNTDMLAKIKYCGSVSGVDVDKSQEFNVSYGETGVPMIAQCPVSLGCELQDTIDTKDMFVFISRVTETMANEDCLSPDNWPVATRVDPIICTIQGGFHKMGSELK